MGREVTTLSEAKLAFDNLFTTICCSYVHKMTPIVIIVRCIQKQIIHNYLAEFDLEFVVASD